MPPDTYGQEDLRINVVDLTSLMSRNLTNCYYISHSTHNITSNFYAIYYQNELGIRNRSTELINTSF